MKAVLIAGCVGVAAAFVPGLAPMKMATPVARATNAEMMPQASTRPISTFCAYSVTDARLCVCASA